jgi:D-sedoheptulose 7-phosphate isomerase
MPSIESELTGSLLRESAEDAMAVCRGLLDPEVTDSVEAVIEAIVAALRMGGKVLLCGNGGSAADAQHLAAELIGRFFLERQPLPAIALADNVSALTAIGNDFDYDQVFRRGVYALGRPGDVLIGISTSGASANVLAALGAGRELELRTVALVGRPDCPMAALADFTIPVRGPNTARIQEGQMVVGHTIFEAVERSLCADD